MKENMTHDDIINQEIEEEHEFMKARIKELENKPTYPFNEAFNKQLQEENEKLKETIRAYQEDRFCQGGCAIYQYDKIHKLTQALEEKEQECEQYKKEINRLNKIGYCYAYEKDCHETCKQQNCIIKNGYKYKKALEEIEKLIPKFDSSTECAYGDFDCENCSSLDEEIVCGYKLKKIILDIINNVKRQ